MKIIPIEEIKTQLLSEGKNKQKFPKTVIFPFEALYTEIVTQIETTEISSECILLNSVEAYNTTKEFSDKSYWKDRISENEIKKYWFFAENGQGDSWLFDDNNTVYFYNHEQEELSPDNFINLEINFGQWLQFAFLSQELDDIYDSSDKLDNETKEEFKQKLQEISKSLLENYPFDL